MMKDSGGIVKVNTNSRKSAVVGFGDSLFPVYASLRMKETGSGTPALPYTGKLPVKFKSIKKILFA
jgi:hypothetical protein